MPLFAPPLIITRAKMISNMRTRPGRTSGQPTVHAGMDLSSGNGTPVIAVEGGTVETVSQDLRPAQGLRGYGNAVVIRHDSSPPYWALYGHMSRVDVAAGQRITAGTLVGRIGNTSNGKFSPPTGMSRQQWRAEDPSDPARSRVMAPHLHLERRRAAPDGSSPYLGTWAGRGYGVLTEDPKPWLESGGLLIARNLSMSVVPGSMMERTAPVWGGLSGCGCGGLGVGDDVIDHGFEPQEFENPYILPIVIGGALFLTALSGVALYAYFRKPKT
jgi:murein DD-endopeptidase MepM/ murein hydrolase activator NlpD